MVQSIKTMVAPISLQTIKISALIKCTLFVNWNVQSLSNIGQ